ncbi:MAG TPA: GYF domain-containing protein [Chthoniobacteraceae bacterium]|nr:GYF domain-containing protein [Chthoniobacteraceae bacterium]
MNWHYESNGQSRGPVSDEEIARLLAAGTINEKTLLWREGLAAWTPLGEVWSAQGAAAPSAAAAAAGAPPEGWIRCTATGRFFPPNEIVYIAGKPYSLEAKDSVVQGVIQTGTVPEDMAERSGPPWERRAQLGWWQAGLQTIKAVLLDPVETFATMKREGGLGGPLLYLVIFASIGGIAGAAYQLLIQLTMHSAMPELQQQQQAQFRGALPFVFTTGMWIAFAAFMPVLIAIGSFIAAGITHLSLMICGGAKQPFETTYRIYCYSSGSVGPLQLIPVCGAYIAGIWGLVCMCIGVAKSHEIGGGRAVIAVLLPAIVCCSGIFVIAMVFGFTAAMAAKGAH